MPRTARYSPDIKRTQPPSPAVKILLALSDDERRLFFPSEGNESRGQYERIDATGMGHLAWKHLLQKSAPKVLISGWSTPPISLEATFIGGGTIDYICHVAGSVRHIVTHEMLAKGLQVTNWGPIVAPQVAEHALLTVLALLRNLGHWPQAMALNGAGKPSETLSTRSLFGKTVSIHGFGAIARELIRLLEPFGTDIRVFSAGVPTSLIREHQATPMPNLKKLAEKSDVFITCEALTPATRNSINASVLNALPQGAVFVNVGRGAVVDEIALNDAARSRGLRIGSDVFAFEPLPVDSPLRGIPGAIFSPHIAGPTLDAYPACGRYALANIERYLNDRPLEGLVTCEIFSRST